MIGLAQIQKNKPQQTNKTCYIVSYLYLRFIPLVPFSLSTLYYPLRFIPKFLLIPLPLQSPLSLPSPSLPDPVLHSFRRHFPASLPRPPPAILSLLSLHSFASLYFLRFAPSEFAEFFLSNISDFSIISFACGWGTHQRRSAGATAPAAAPTNLHSPKSALVTSNAAAGSGGKQAVDRRSAMGR